MEYRVKWEIELTADSPREAARLALEIQRDRSSLATVFHVVEEEGTAHWARRAFVVDVADRNDQGAEYREVQ